MKKLFFSFLLILVSICTFAQVNPVKVADFKAQYRSVIEGEVIGIPSSKLYLVDAYQWRNKLDSAEYKEGKFKFVIKDNKEPFLASIVYFTKENKMHRLAFINNELSKNNSVAFMTDDGLIKIRGDWTGVTSIFNLKPLKIEAGKQNRFYQQNYPKNIGIINDESPQKHTESFNDTRRLVKENPYAFYLFGELYNNKSSFTNKELEELLIMFDDRVKKSTKAAELNKYLMTRKEVNQLTSLLILKNSNNIVKEGINKNKKLNMLIFWASWCVPCRSEIPLLKNIKNSITSQDFYMASISIDKTRSNWLKALKEENMEWDQFIIETNDFNRIKMEYDCSAIPLIIFTDQTGKILKRTEGFSENLLEEYRNFIKSALE
ncbi:MULTISPECIES: TlpA disulfide reductase family protein [unclassified Sphingobacterium]|uniref:TlpA disulfide reductase family protein n=1 Tax=unclassified Sphingobacterium TaxID=2609468 RepID=UPI0025FBEC62|nr:MULTISPECIES: TlpA disulfide reductase family protein [unclassified Sphingobacterium]